jgi:hypothetical protein
MVTLCVQSLFVDIHLSNYSQIIVCRWDNWQTYKLRDDMLIIADNIIYVQLWQF